MMVCAYVRMRVCLILLIPFEALLTCVRPHVCSLLQVCLAWGYAGLWPPLFPCPFGPKRGCCGVNIVRGKGLGGGGLASVGTCAYVQVCVWCVYVNVCP